MSRIFLSLFLTAVLVTQTTPSRAGEIGNRLVAKTLKKVHTIDGEMMAGIGEHKKELRASESLAEASFKDLGRYEKGTSMYVKAESELAYHSAKVLKSLKAMLTTLRDKTITKVETLNSLLARLSESRSGAVAGGMGSKELTAMNAGTIRGAEATLGSLAQYAAQIKDPRVRQELNAAAGVLSSLKKSLALVERNYRAGPSGPSLKLALQGLASSLEALEVKSEHLISIVESKSFRLAIVSQIKASQIISGEVAGLKGGVLSATDGVLTPTEASLGDIENYLSRLEDNVSPSLYEPENDWINSVETQKRSEGGE